MKKLKKFQQAPSALHLLHRAGQHADEVFASRTTGTGLTPRQFAVIKAIATSEEPSQTDLVERTGIDRSTMADIVRRLTSRGLVQRRRTRQDARMYAVRLTERGSTLLKTAEPAARYTDDAILSTLSPGQRSAFIKSLNRIVVAMDESSTGGLD